MKALTVHKRKSLTIRHRHYRLPAPVYPVSRITETEGSPSLPRVPVTVVTGFISDLFNNSAAWLHRLKGSAGRIEYTTLPPRALRQPAREIADVLMLRGF